MTKIYVLTEISSCNNEHEGVPLAMDEQFVFTNKKAAQEKLEELYNECMAYDGKSGEVLEDESNLSEGYFYVVLYDGETSVTIYRGEIKEFKV